DRLRCVWRNDGVGLSRVNTLSLDYSQTSEAFLSTARSQCGLFAHRRHLHSIRIRYPAWGMGLDTASHRLVSCCDRNNDEVHRWYALQLDLDCSLSSDGLAGCCCSQANIVVGTSTRHYVDIGRWHCLHEWSCVFRRTSPALWPFYLAPVCYCRYDL